MSGAPEDPPEDPLVRYATVDAGGRAVQVGTCRASLVPMQAAPAGGQAVALAAGAPAVTPGDWRLDGGTWLHDPVAVPLADVKAELLRRVNHQAEAARLRVITPGAGQALEYQATEADARAFLAADLPDLADYPFLEAEVDAIEDATGVLPAVETVAAEVIAQAEAWRTAGSAIKRLRRAAILAIEAAGTEAAARAAAQVAWPA